MNWQLKQPWSWPPSPSPLLTQARFFCVREIHVLRIFLEEFFFTISTSNKNLQTWSWNSSHYAASAVVFPCNPSNSNRCIGCVPSFPSQVIKMKTSQHFKQPEPMNLPFTMYQITLTPHESNIQTICYQTACIPQFHRLLQQFNTRLLLSCLLLG